jgi:hypothetical protein
VENRLRTACFVPTIDNWPTGAVSMKYRDFTNMYGNGKRTLFESVVAPEVLSALRDWKSASAGGVLIGGLALSKHTRPRYTQDVDFLFGTDAEIPDKVSGFRKTRSHAFQHNKTHVEIEMVTTDLVGVPIRVAAAVVSTALESDGLRYASAAGLVALKLFRLSAQDKADIIALIKAQSVKAADLDPFELTEDQVALFVGLVHEAEHDPHP